MSETSELFDSNGDAVADNLAPRSHVRRLTQMNVFRLIMTAFDPVASTSPFAPFDSSRAQRIAAAQTRGCRPPTRHISQQPLGEALLLYRNGRTVDARINTLRRRDCRRRPRARQDHHRRHIEFLEVLSFRSAHLRRARISRRAEAATAARRDRSAAPCYPASSGIRHPGQIPEEGSYRSAPP